MNLVVTTEHHFIRTPDGAVWTQTAYAHSFWTRYLELFDQVRVIARVREVAAPDGEWVRADGEAVSFAALPDYLGPLQFLCRLGQLRSASRAALQPRDALLLRVCSPIAATLVPSCRQAGRPYGVVVVGDPADVFAPGVVRHPLRPLLRWHFSHQLRAHCRAACAAAYVTEQTLQRRYPCPAYSVGVSDVELDRSAFVTRPRTGGEAPTRPFTLVSVGSLAQLYKAPDVLIDAFGTCVAQGLDLRLVLVGDGRYRPFLEERARSAGLSERIRFRGQLPAGEAVRAELDRADLFVLPSRTEGLPRAMVEAMARALPCIGSDVGGIPELLPPEDRVPAGDRAALAARIHEVVTDPGRLARMSARNLERSQQFHQDLLREKEQAFCQYLYEQSLQWLKSRPTVA